MGEVKLLTINNPQMVRKFAVLAESPWGITYVTHYKGNKPTKIDIVLDVEDEKDQRLLEALLWK